MSKMSKKFLMDKISSSSQIKQESEGEHPNKRIKAESEIKNDLNNNPINGNSAAGNDVEVRNNLLRKTLYSLVPLPLVF